MKDLAALLLPAEQRARFLEEIKATLTPAQFETVRAVFEEAAERIRPGKCSRQVGRGWSLVGG